VAKEEPAQVLAIGGREVRVTNPSKLYFSRAAQLTKLELVQYYLSVAAGALHAREVGRQVLTQLGHLDVGHVVSLKASLKCTD
jgi:hypothetical protein